MSARHGTLAIATAAALAGCIPYPAATTAATLAPNEVTTSGIVGTVPVGFGWSQFDSSRAVARGLRPLVDWETRVGLDSRSDFGLRFTTWSGAVATYKRQFGPNAGRAGDDRWRFALMPGIGVVNMGDHAHFEGTAIVSSGWKGAKEFYGGLRVMQVVPLSRDAVRDRPTRGGFVGARLGDRLRNVGFELAVFHDPSALGLNPRDVIVVPSLSFTGMAR